MVLYLDGLYYRTMTDLFSGTCCPTTPSATRWLRASDSGPKPSQVDHEIPGQVSRLMLLRAMVRRLAFGAETMKIREDFCGNFAKIQI